MSARIQATLEFGQCDKKSETKNKSPGWWSGKVRVTPKSAINQITVTALPFGQRARF